MRFRSRSTVPKAPVAPARRVAPNLCRGWTLRRSREDRARRHPWAYRSNRVPVSHVSRRRARPQRCARASLERQWARSPWCATRGSPPPRGLPARSRSARPDRSRAPERRRRPVRSRSRGRSRPFRRGPCQVSARASPSCVLAPSRRRPRKRPVVSPSRSRVQGRRRRRPRPRGRSRRCRRGRSRASGCLPRSAYGPRLAGWSMCPRVRCAATVRARRRRHAR